MQRPLRIGTRGSPLAIAQAEEVRARLCDAHGLAPGDFEIAVIKTTGDKVLGQALSSIGGKGLFTKEIEEGLYSKAIDIAVHSMKDMPTVYPDGLTIDCFLPREDPRDAFVSPVAADLMGLPEGARIGTASLRREAQAKAMRPDLKVGLLRGNVATRLGKLEAGEFDATFLAYAGLRRLGKEEVVTSLMDPDVFVPAVAQGAIGIERRVEDEETAALLRPLNDARTEICASAERAFLRVLDGSCRTPIAALAQFDSDDEIILRGRVLSPDGAQSFSQVRRGAAAEAVALGTAAGEAVIEEAGRDFLEQIKI